MIFGGIFMALEDPSASVQLDVAQEMLKRPAMQPRVSIGGQRFRDVFFADTDI